MNLQQALAPQNKKRATNYFNTMLSFPVDAASRCFVLGHFERSPYVTLVDPEPDKRLCQEIKEEANLSKLGCGLFNEKCYVWCHSYDIGFIYEVVNAFLRRNRWFCLADETGIVFPPWIVASFRTHESLHRQRWEWNVKQGPDMVRFCRQREGLPVENDLFWISAENRQVVTAIRKCLN